MNYLIPLFLYVLTFIFVVYKYKTYIATEGFADVQDQCVDEENKVRKLTSDEKEEISKKSNKVDKKVDKKVEKKVEKKLEKKMS